MSKWSYKLNYRSHLELGSKAMDILKAKEARFKGLKPPADAPSRIKEKYRDLEVKWNLKFQYYVDILRACDSEQDIRNILREIESFDMNLY